MVRRARKLTAFARREISDWRRLRGELGFRGATTARVKANLYLDGVDGATLRAIEADVEELGSLRREVARLAAEAESTRAQERILAETELTGATPPGDGPVSVILVPGERPAGAARAVLDQSHTALELLVPESLASDLPADERVRTVESSEGESAAAAVNAALRAAAGSVVAYAEPGRPMHRLWLQAAAAAVEDGADVVCGAALREGGGVERPPLDAREAEHAVGVALGAIAHRNGAEGAGIDEGLGLDAPFELLVRLARGGRYRPLPVLAQLGTAKGAGESGALRAARARIREARPPRVLGYNAMFPLITETYIHDEVQALAQNGAEIAFCCGNRVPSPMPVEYPVYYDLDVAVREFAPDVLMLHWATHAMDSLPQIERHGLPFGLRVHSFDFDPGVVAALRDHPLCAGVWLYPHLADMVDGAHPLPTLFSSVDRMPEPAAKRDLILSVSAGLPKKIWPTIIEAMAMVPGADRRIVMGMTIGHEDEAAKIGRMLEEIEAPPLLQVNLTRDLVFGLLSRAALLVYTLEDGLVFGNPMSVVEAMAAGASVVLPERPETRAMVGPGFRGYRDASDIAAHAVEALRGGPAVEEEREQNRRRARELFCSPADSERFTAELLEGVDRVLGAGAPRDLTALRG